MIVGRLARYHCRPVCDMPLSDSQVWRSEVALGTIANSAAILKWLAA